jgi:alpha-D-ribose 1-methylphosphonate 5-triphosphate synthase subunit PhnL
MALVEFENLCKSFNLHTQGGARIPVLRNFNLAIDRGESLALTGPSGVGKSTVLRLLYGNYRVDSGAIRVQVNGRPADVARADPHTILALRRNTIGYVSQFLRVIPRIPALEIVMEPLVLRGIEETKARRAAMDLMERLALPRRLWPLSPTTFSGGEQQRLNIARGFIAPFPLMILDEPTASLDPDNAAAVKQIIQSAVQVGTTVIGIYHDPDLRDELATRTVALEAPAPGGADQSAVMS